MLTMERTLGVFWQSNFISSKKKFYLIFCCQACSKTFTLISCKSSYSMKKFRLTIKLNIKKKLKQWARATWPVGRGALMWAQVTNLSQCSRWLKHMGSNLLHMRNNPVMPWRTQVIFKEWQRANTDYTKNPIYFLQGFQGQSV